MSISDSRHPTAAAAVSFGERVDELLCSLDRLAEVETRERTFYEAVLAGLLQTVSPASGAVWDVDDQGHVKLVRETRLPAIQTSGSQQAELAHISVVQATCTLDTAHLIRPGEVLPGLATRRSPFDSVLVAVPIRYRAGTRVLELFLDDQSADAECRKSVDLLNATAELCTVFERNQRLRELEAHDTDRQRFVRVLNGLHGSLDLRTTCFRVANDGRQFLACDRVSVVVRRGSRFRTEAISGMDTFDRRSPTVRLLEALARRTAALGEPVWSDDLTGHMPPQIVEPLETYQDESHVRTIGLVPLVPNEGDENSTTIIGLLIIEQFTEPISDETRRNVLALARHAATAVGNAVQHSSLPLLPLSKAIRHTAQRCNTATLTKTAAIGAVVLVILAMLLFVNADFKVEARGTLEPLARREIFAPTDGVIVHVSVTHGQQVRAGQELLQVQDTELALELQRVLGELQTARQRLSAVETDRIGSTASRERDQRKRITAEEEELKELMQSFEEQYAILELRREQLTVLSPIDGEVMTWDVRQRLDARPVRRGQALMTLADTDGAWGLELRVAEKDIVHLRSAEESESPVRVDYVLATDPRVAHQGHLLDIAPAAQIDEQGRRMITLRSATSSRLTDVTPGTTVVAKLHCGRRSLGFVWFRDIIDALRSLWTL